MRASKLRLPDSTAQVTASWSLMDFSRSASIGPEAPKQVVQL